MRVISGAARRMILLAPKGQNTRPSADRIKENLFNILSPNIPGARFLDMFCGSGAIGIEALSRGASEACFVDSSQEAIDITQANLARTNLTPRAAVLHMSAQRAISQLEREDRWFDIIFMDPPYGSSLINHVLDDLGILLADGGILVVECGGDNAPVTPGHLELYDEREYGNTRLLFYVRKLKII